jgi:hypothetical protein
MMTMTMNAKVQDKHLKKEDTKTSSIQLERKRQREKARRGELAKAFDVLGSLVSDLETNEEIAAANRKKARTSGADEDSSGLTQLEVIHKSHSTMRRLHEENKTLKQEMLLVLKHQLHQMKQESMQDKRVAISTPTELVSRQPLTKAPRVVSNSDLIHQPVVYADQGAQNWPQDAHHPQPDFSQQSGPDCWERSFAASATFLALDMCLDECLPQDSDDWTSPIPHVDVDEDDFASAGWTALLCLTEG